MKSSSLTVLAALALLPDLTACAGNGSSAPAKLAASTVRSPLESAVADDLLYVSNVGSNSITVYPHEAAGNTAPLYVIAGSNTGLSAPGQLSEDSAGNLYVLNGSTIAASAKPAVLVFAHGANGNVAPIRTLAGPATDLQHADAMTVDQATGKIYAAIDEEQAGPAMILRFAPKASGNTAPLAKSAPASGIFVANQLASDSTGKYIINAHIPPCCTFAEVGTQTIAKNFANNSTPTMPYSVAALLANGVADDSTTHTYLVTNDKGIYRLAEDTVGDGPEGPGPANWMPPPISVITSDTCGYQLAVAPGPDPNTYVTHNTMNGCPADAVYVYTNSASGNAAPLRVLSGSATLLDQPYGIYEGK